MKSFNLALPEIYLQTLYLTVGYRIMEIEDFGDQHEPWQKDEYKRLIDLREYILATVKEEWTIEEFTKWPKQT